MLCTKLPDKDVQILLDNLRDASQFWDAISNDHEDEQYNDLVQSATHYYGGPESVLPFVDMKSLKKVLFGACKFLKRVLSEERGLGKINLICMHCSEITVVFSINICSVIGLVCMVSML